MSGRPPSIPLDMLLPRPPGLAGLSGFRVIDCPPAEDDVAITYERTSYTAKRAMDFAQDDGPTSFLGRGLLALLAAYFSGANDRATICYPSVCPKAGCNGSMAHFFRVGGNKDYEPTPDVAKKFQLLIWCERCRSYLQHWYQVPEAVILSDGAIRDGLLRRRAIEELRQRMPNAESAVTTLIYRGIRRSPIIRRLSPRAISRRNEVPTNTSKRSAISRASSQSSRHSEPPLLLRSLPSFQAYIPVRPPPERRVFRLRWSIFVRGQVKDGWWIWDAARNPLNNGPLLHKVPGQPGQATVFLLGSKPWISESFVNDKLVERYDYYELKWVRWSPARAILLDTDNETVAVFNVNRSAISRPHMHTATSFKWDQANDQWTSATFESDD
ncbi:hypothetical protein CYLTODRAFT_458932 [Cylindrobasidium torrendii FP15055 ss-10]|uniref:Uncharacterized protein n=1 Tax=Cylindrobasidium torrendii FP15055 ss-10 TaxID=1314674 RepID=A0A0D7AWB3_9AGAR|nr:hypothetical protein CYLTODRAFT_458932 [Cylindrobasidium torrendii FP15055 ss-10]